MRPRLRLGSRLRAGLRMRLTGLAGMYAGLARLSGMYAGLTGLPTARRRLFLGLYHFPNAVANIRQLDSPVA
jgi:hypothetical protein